MDIERLTARNKDGIAYLVNVKPDEQEVDSPHKNTLKCILDCFERLAQYEDEAIARQPATSEDVKEAIDQVEGTRRKAQKELDSLTETKSRYDHQIEIGDPWKWKWEESWHSLAVEGNKQTIKNANLAITALQAYQPWVSVSDRLPDGDVASVLIHTNKGGVSEGQYYPCIKSWKQFRWSVENADVTHWKPLPEPPKGE